MDEVLEPKMPEMPDYHREKLLYEGYHPVEWMTSKMLAKFWNVSLSGVSQARRRRMLPEPIRIGHINFFPKIKSLQSWVPISNDDRYVLQAAAIIQEEVEKIEELKEKGEVVLNPETNYLTLPKELRDKIPPKDERRYITSRRVGYLPSKEVTKAAYLKTLAEEVSVDDWRDIVRRAVDDAIDGDTKARQWLSNYLIGTPIRRVAQDINVRTQKFSEEERLQALKKLLDVEGGYGGTGEVIDADFADTEEASGQDDNWEPVMDASPEQPASD